MWMSEELFNEVLTLQEFSLIPPDTFPEWWSPAITLSLTTSSLVMPEVCGHKAIGNRYGLGINLQLFPGGEGLVFLVDLHILHHLELVCVSHLVGPFLDHHGRQGHVRISQELL